MTDQEKAEQWVAANRVRMQLSEPHAVAALVVLIKKVRADERERVAKEQLRSDCARRRRRAEERDEAELGEVLRLLADAPWADILKRASLEARRDELRERLGMR